jgi:uncharacterized Zn-finger protein
MEGYPKFHNEVGVPIVRIGCREFKCIGDKPPQDHPHIYLKMGDASEIVCPMNRLRPLRIFLIQSIHEAAVSLYVARSALF